MLKSPDKKLASLSPLDGAGIRASPPSKGVSSGPADDSTQRGLNPLSLKPKQDSLGDSSKDIAKLTEIPGDANLKNGDPFKKNPVLGAIPVAPAGQESSEVPTEDRTSDPQQQHSNESNRGDDEDIPGGSARDEDGHEDGSGRKSPSNRSEDDANLDDENNDTGERYRPSSPILTKFQERAHVRAASALTEPEVAAAPLYPILLSFHNEVVSKNSLKIAIAREDPVGVEMVTQFLFASRV
jgi:hypothetical protein